MIDFCFIKYGGSTIKYPDFKDKYPELFQEEVHLSFIGSGLSFNTIQGSFDNSIQKLLYLNLP